MRQNYADQRYECRLFLLLGKPAKRLQYLIINRVFQCHIQPCYFRFPVSE